MRAMQNSAPRLRGAGRASGGRVPRVTSAAAAARHGALLQPLPPTSPNNVAVIQRSAGESAPLAFYWGETSFNHCLLIL